VSTYPSTTTNTIYYYYYTRENEVTSLSLAIITLFMLLFLDVTFIPSLLCVFGCYFYSCLPRVPVLSL
jgi:hypothetical protein